MGNGRVMAGGEGAGQEDLMKFDKAPAKGKQVARGDRRGGCYGEDLRSETGVEGPKCGARGVGGCL